MRDKKNVTQPANDPRPDLTDDHALWQAALEHLYGHGHTETGAVLASLRDGGATISVIDDKPKIHWQHITYVMPNDEIKRDWLKPRWREIQAALEHAVSSSQQHEAAA